MSPQRKLLIRHTTERTILQDIFFRSMTEGKTVIIVTHRISVASLADRIVVFKDGEIVEDGTHEKLISSGGEYARLYSTQARWYDR